MLEDLDQLSTRVAQLVQLTQHVRAENQALRTELGQRDAHIKRLRDTMEIAQIRVEDVLARLPGKPPEAVDDANAGSDASGDSSSDIDSDIDSDMDPSADLDDGATADGEWSEARTDADTDPPLPDEAGHGVRSAHGTP